MKSGNQNGQIDKSNMAGSAPSNSDRARSASNMGEMLAQAKRLEASGQTQKARELLGEVLVKEPGNRDALTAMGRLCIQGRLFDKAVEAHSVLVEMFPQDPRAHNALGLSLAMSNALDSAQAHLQTAVKLAPQERVYLANLGKLLIMQGKWMEAQNSLDKALDLSQGGQRDELKELLSQCRNAIAEQCISLG